MQWKWNEWTRITIKSLHIISISIKSLAKGQQAQEKKQKGKTLHQKNKKNNDILSLSFWLYPEDGATKLEHGFCNYFQWINSYSIRSICIFIEKLFSICVKSEYFDSKGKRKKQNNTLQIFSNVSVVMFTVRWLFPVVFVFFQFFQKLSLNIL